MTAGARLIRISSRALDDRTVVRVWIYDTLDEMRAACTRFNGADVSDAVGVTQARVNDDNTAVQPIIRLARDWLGSQVVSHELHHAATAIWGAHVRATGRDADLVHYNEPFAHLYSDLFAALARAMFRHGYW